MLQRSQKLVGNLLRADASFVVFLVLVSLAVRYPLLSFVSEDFTDHT